MTERRREASRVRRGGQRSTRRHAWPPNEKAARETDRARPSRTYALRRTNVAFGVVSRTPNRRIMKCIVKSTRLSRHLRKACRRWEKFSTVPADARKVGGRTAQLFMDSALESLAQADSPSRKDANYVEDRHSLVDTPTTSVLKGSDVRDVDRIVPVDRTIIDETLLNAQDPFELVKDDVESIANDVKRILGSKHKVLETVAQYFFEMDSGKKLRPVLVLLMSAAVNKHHLASSSCPDQEQFSRINSSQRRLAEITEMIHTASLLHDDVLDMADTRRGAKSVNMLFGNKLAVLAGDFLLARASVCLARLRDVEVIETLSTVIEHLVKGEILQMSGLTGQLSIDSMNVSATCFGDYTKKNYYKTGSLIANSCKSASMLSGIDDPAAHAAAFDFGMHFGTAFQLIDDVLDFEGTVETLGKEPLADLRSGLTTAPVLFAQREFDELTPMIARKFDAPGDVEKAAEYVRRSNACAETRKLADAHADLAMHAVMGLAQSEERDALLKIVEIASRRSK